MIDDWQLTLGRISGEVSKANRNKGEKVRLFTEQEFLMALGLLIAVAKYGQRGVSDQNDGHEMESMVPHPSFLPFFLEL
jgi:hypothetical protein